jgi:quinol monooxygenase YgiN
MFLAIVDVHVDPADRPAAIAQLEGEQPDVRAMPGCIDFRVLVPAGNGTDVTVLHEWSDEDAFRAYLDSDAFQRSGAVLRPMMSAAPASRRFRAELVETVA